MTQDSTGDLPDDVLALLADEAVWRDVDPAVDDLAIAAVLSEVETAAPVSPRRFVPLRPVLAAAAVVLVLVGAAVVIRSSGSDDAGFEVALGGTALAPDASANARITDTPSGTRIILSTRDLAPAPDGTYYEAWLRTGPEVGVSAGTFHLRGGDSEIELWAGVSTDDYPLLTVTLQPEGLSGSSGEVVLIARLDG